ncbi:MAG: AMP-binding protein [Anaerolineae bacterium]|nr:AMP-binding protein [Anaerolineae bacterium]
MASDWLFDRLQAFGDRLALIWQDQRYSYRQMLDGVAQWQQILAEQELAPGQCVALSGDFLPDTIMLLLALIANRNIVVPLTSSVGSKREDYLKAACTSAIFEFDNAGAWRFAQGNPSADHPLLQRLRANDEPGLIIFSSGSTGIPKASIHYFHKILDKFKKPGKPYRALTFLRLDHIGGINTLFQMLCSGGAVINVPQRTVDNVCRAIEQHQVQLLPTTPTFLNMLLLSESHKVYNLSSLEVVSYGAEPMPATTLSAISKMLPNVKFRQLYGLTELGILPTKPAMSDSLWLNVGNNGCECRVVEGVLWVRTETAMLGYLNAPSPFDEDGWFNTGDAVEQKNGYLRILGRASELINVGGEKVFPAEVENVILQMDNIKDVSVFGKANPLIGQVVMARVELCQPEDHQALEKRVRMFCKKHLAPFKVPVAVQLVFSELYSDRFKKIRRQTEVL